MLTEKEKLEHHRLASKKCYLKQRKQRLADAQQYYIKHQDQCLARSNNWRLKNKDKCHAATQRWRVLHPEHCRHYSRDWGRKHPDCAHKHKLKYRYGLTIEEYNSRLKDQNNVCAICQRPEIATYRSKTPQHLSVDHDHKTGKNRGLLCDRCNRALGQFGESQVLMQSALAYLRKWSDQ